MGRLLIVVMLLGICIGSSDPIAIQEGILTILKLIFLGGMAIVVLRGIVASWKAANK
jgi:hypothetical protein